METDRVNCPRASPGGSWRALRITMIASRNVPKEDCDEHTTVQGFTVPKGVLHRTRAPVRSVILMIEGAGVVPTGD